MRPLWSLFMLNGGSILVWFYKSFFKAVLGKNCGVFDWSWFGTDTTVAVENGVFSYQNRLRVFDEFRFIFLFQEDAEHHLLKFGKRDFYQKCS